MVLWLLTLYIAQIKESISKEELNSELKAIRKTPKALIVTDKLHDKIHRLSKKDSYMVTA